jgi:hypothetical protein
VLVITRSVPKDADNPTGAENPSGRGNDGKPVAFRLTPICGNNMFNVSRGVRHCGIGRLYRSMVGGIAGLRDLTMRQLRQMLRLRALTG